MGGSTKRTLRLTTIRLKKRLSKQKKDVGSVDIQIEALENELEKLEESISSVQLGTNIEAGGD